jgi:integrase/recombinase XerD
MMSDPAHVRVDGPLAALMVEFRGNLADLGYAPGSAAQQLQMLAHLSGWMAERGLVVQQLAPVVIEEFFRSRRRSHTNLRTARSLDPFLGFLDRGGMTRSQVAGVEGPAWGLVCEQFDRYLADDRGLAATTVGNYLNQARPFLRWRAGRTDAPLSDVSIDEVTGFLLLRAGQESAGSVRVAVTALRALLRWLYLTQIIGEPLADGIGPVTYSGFGGLPKALAPAQVQALLAQAAASPLSRYRDQAIVLVLSRLGLRSRELAELGLDDVGWRTGTMTVHGKGATCDVMPIPVDVGEAIAGYLEHERPTTNHHQVFAQTKAPHGPLGRSGVSCVISRLGVRAGISTPVGAHRLRHSAATGVLAGGGTLTEAAQLLRHASPTTTVIYARVDLGALATATRPWPTRVLETWPATAAGATS